MKDLDYETAQDVTELCRLHVIEFVPQKDWPAAMESLMGIVRASYSAASALAMDSMSDTAEKVLNVGNN